MRTSTLHPAPCVPRGPQGSSVSWAGLHDSNGGAAGAADRDAAPAQARGRGVCTEARGRARCVLTHMAQVVRGGGGKKTRGVALHLGQASTSRPAWMSQMMTTAPAPAHVCPPKLNLPCSPHPPFHRPPLHLPSCPRPVYVEELVAGGAAAKTGAMGWLAFPPETYKAHVACICVHTGRFVRGVRCADAREWHGCIMAIMAGPHGRPPNGT